MGKRDAFHTEDDPRRMAIFPSGYRDFCGSDGQWSAHVEREVILSSMQDSLRKLHAKEIASNTGEIVKQLKIAAKLRSQLDALEAILLADGHEMAQRGMTEAAVQGTLFEDELQEKSAHHYQVDPSDSELVRSSFVTEAAMVSRQPQRVVRKKLTTAEGLRNLCPATLAELCLGNITTKSAIEIVSSAQDLQPEQVGQLEQVLLPVARTSTDDTVTRHASKLRARMLPQTAQERHEKDHRSRYVRWWAEKNGMALVQAYVAAPFAMALVNTLNWHREDLRDPNDERTDEQIRADIFCDVFLNGWPETKGAAARPRVTITIPAVEMLVDRNRSLADLEGYGPIPMGLALQMAKEAPSFLRVLTDPWTGAPIDIGRQRYRPSQVLRDFLRVRDEHCRFPGCRKQPDNSEIDHIKDWAKGGETSKRNTRLLCRQHQMYKHALGWQSTYMPDGSVLWRSPHGVIQTELPGSIRSLESFDPDPIRNPMLPSIEVTDQLRRVLGWHDPPPEQQAS